MLNGHNGNVLPQPVLPMVEEPETDVVQTIAAPSGSGDVTQEDPKSSSRLRSTTGTPLHQLVLMRKLGSAWWLLSSRSLHLGGRQRRERQSC